MGENNIQSIQRKCGWVTKWFFSTQKICQAWCKTNFQLFQNSLLLQLTWTKFDNSVDITLHINFNSTYELGKKNPARQRRCGDRTFARWKVCTNQTSNLSKGYRFLTDIYQLPMPNLSKIFPLFDSHLWIDCSKESGIQTLDYVWCLQTLGVSKRHY